MFERFTESARRTLFFARYEASRLGSTSIETEHLLLGVIRQPDTLIATLFARADVPIESIRRDLERVAATNERVSTSVEIPFSEDVKHALHQAAVEADGAAERNRARHAVYVRQLACKSSQSQQAAEARDVRPDQLI